MRKSENPRSRSNRARAKASRAQAGAGARINRSRASRDDAIRKWMRLYTRNAWVCFDVLRNADLDLLLEAAGVVVPRKRPAKIEAGLLVWFGGRIPDWEKLREIRDFNIFRV